MASFVLPDNRNRSATAVDGKSDMRDENLYSSLVVSHGGSGQQKIFTVPQGQTIPPKKVAAAANSSNPLLAKRAQLAQTFARFRK